VGLLTISDCPALRLLTAWWTQTSDALHTLANSRNTILKVVDLPAAGIDRLARPLQIKEVGDSIGHDGNSVSGCAIRSCGLGVSHRDLLVV